MRPLVVAIAGPSGSGKSHLARLWQEQEGIERCAIFSLDAYYRDLRDLPDHERGEVNFDHPDALDQLLMARHLQALLIGEGIGMPVYDFATHTRMPDSISFQPRALILVEGIFALALQAVREACSVKIYVDVPADVCLERRIRRDATERGRDPNEIRQRFDQWVRPSMVAWVQPQRDWADLVLDGNQPIAELVQAGREYLSLKTEVD